MVGDPSKGGKNWRIEGQKRRITRKEYRRLWNEFEMGGIHGTERSMESRQGENAAGQVHCLRKKETLSDSIRPCMKRIS